MYLSTESKHSLMLYKNTAVSARAVSKSYLISHNATKTSSAKKERFLALQDVNFDIAQGDVVGIIGRNGAGKSTLLKILSRITTPTEGEIQLFGRVGSLLEVGTGFHHELTGRENIYLNGAILGMRRREIDRQFDAIVEFAGVEKFLDTPVKRYSSGMYVRLAFAVAAHLSSDILIIDEVLAVGDAEFQKKCLGKMEDVSRQGGRTVLFVSHNMATVQALCNQCLFFRQGKLCFQGATDEAIARYMDTGGVGNNEIRPGEFYLREHENKYLPGTAIIQKAIIFDDQGNVTNTLQMGRPMTLAVEIEGMLNYAEALIGLIVKSGMDQPLINFNTGMKPPRTPQQRQHREWILLRVPRIPFTPGTYWIDLGVGRRSEMLDYVDRAAQFHVVEADVYGTGYHPTNSEAVFFLDAEWEFVGDTLVDTINKNADSPSLVKPMLTAPASGKIATPSEGF
jgi:lipopolysaccharide transport system ATP-binding protein